MENLSISTAQNVNIDYQLASVGDRIFAYLLDLIIQIVYVVLVLVVLFAGFEANGWWISLFFLPMLFYHLLCEAFLNGQSFGKMVMKVKVAKMDGSELRFIDCFLRWLFRVVDFNLPIGGVLVGLLTIVIGGKGQRIGDIVAKTTVIKNNFKGSLAATAYVEVEDDYQPQYPEVSVLSDTDMQTIKEVLNIAARDNSYSNIGAPHPLVLKTKEVVVKKMRIETKQPGKEFLITVLKDYNYYHR